MRATRCRESPTTLPSKPSYYVVADAGRTQEKIGTNRQRAQRVLDKVNVTLHETGEWEPPKRITFSEHWDEWYAGLRRPRQSTKRSYTSTGDYAKKAFGHTIVRQVGVTHVQRLLDEMTKEKLSGSTQAKRLRVLSACFRSAVARGYATRNPVAELSSAEKPRARQQEAAYFTNDELPKLIASLGEGLDRTIVLAAIKTGLRLGELLELRWSDLDLLTNVLRVRRGYVQGVGAEGTKSHQARTVDLTDEVVKLFGAWWAESGSPNGDSLVFPGPAADGHLDPGAVTKRILYPAMKRAGVDRVGPTGEKRTFHSLRQTFARYTLESGLSLTWPSRQMGHSGTAITDRTYGHWSREAAKAEAQAMAGVFPV